MRDMRRYEFQGVDGTVQFNGRKITQLVAEVRLPSVGQAHMTVTIYVCESGDGIIREEITVAHLNATFVHVVHAGTSPRFTDTESMSLLEAAWSKACTAESCLRPVRQWKISEGYDEYCVPTGANTHLEIRVPR